MAPTQFGIGLLLNVAIVAKHSASVTGNLIYLGVIKATIASVVFRIIQQTVGTATPNWLATAR